jgi:hypothetical protein
MKYEIGNMKKMFGLNLGRQGRGMTFAVGKEYN